MIDTDKAYLIGLIIGGGILKNGFLQIVLPYKKWGDIEINPKRGGKIAEDILKRIGPTWKSTYNIDISYSIDSSWKIICQNISPELKSDLKELGLPLEGEYRYVANIDTLKKKLTSEAHKKAFITGLVDTVGSLAKSHRRFVDNFQIISFEFKGVNFLLVKSVAEILIELDCTPDQILWNHPNQHSPSNRYYKNWKKGFKIRVSLNDYMLKGGFVFEAKKLSADSNKDLQVNVDATVKGKVNKISGRVCLHTDQNTDWLPQDIRGGVFIHYTHLAEHLGLSLSQKFNSEKFLPNFSKYFCPFTCLTKGTLNEIEEIIEHESYLKKTNYRTASVNVKKLFEIQKNGGKVFLFGKTENDGFPLNSVLQGLSYVLCADHEERMFGKRIRKNYEHWIELEAKEQSRNDINFLIPDVGTCLVITSPHHSALIGYINNDFNKTLIKSIDNLKVLIEEPIHKNCISLS